MKDENVRPVTILTTGIMDTIHIVTTNVPEVQKIKEYGLSNRWWLLFRLPACIIMLYCQILILITKGGFCMQVNALADIALAQMPAMSPANDVSIAMLSKQLDVSQQMGEDMIKAMEQSVNPGVGGNIDVYA